MAETCCCGCCSLSSATTVSIAICMLESIYGLFWNVQLWLLLDGNTNLHLLSHFISVNCITDTDAVNGLTLASAGIHIFWMVFGLMVLRGNASLNHGLMAPWIHFTQLVTAFDIGSSIYFFVKFQEHYHSSTSLEVHKHSAALTYLVLAVLFSRGIIMWFVNVYLAHIVSRRGKEIDHTNSMMALYILSHLSHNPDSGLDQTRIALDAPPAYCSPNYFPKYVVGEARDFESSWSLSNETVQGINAFSNPLYPRLAQNSVNDLRRAANENRNTFYGSASVEQSLRNTDGGVLP